MTIAKARVSLRSRADKMNKQQMKDQINALSINKRSDGKPIGIKDKPKRMTSKQIGFMQSIAKGNDRKTAYTENYNVRSTNNNSINATARKLENKIIAEPLFNDLLKSSLEKNLDDQRVVRNHVMQELLQHSLNGRPNEKLKALELLGRSIGMYQDNSKIEQTVTKVSTAKLKEELEKSLNAMKISKNAH
tara:strand:+ start:381 stop:950 length:570 start_codon:yes stop_codon:yes gene_type:complete